MMSRLAIIGAGAIGLAWAADLVSRGFAVSGLVETDPVRRDALLTRPMLNLTGFLGARDMAMPEMLDMERAGKADWLLVATTADRHADVARALAPYMRSDTVIVLATGYADGSANFRDCLENSACPAEPLVIELNTTPYLSAIAGPGHVHVAAAKSWLEAAGSDRVRLESQRFLLAKLIPEAEIVPDALASSLNNPNPIAHVPAYIANLETARGGAPAGERGGAFYLDDFVTPQINRDRAVLDQERLNVMKAHGLRAILRADFSLRAYGTPPAREKTPPRIANTFPSRMMDEDVPCGLVPIERMGIAAGLETPMMTKMIDLMSRAAGVDWRAKGTRCASATTRSRKEA